MSAIKELCHGELTQRFALKIVSCALLWKSQTSTAISRASSESMYSWNCYSVEIMFFFCLFSFNNFN